MRSARPLIGVGTPTLPNLSVRLSSHACNFSASSAWAANSSPERCAKSKSLPSSRAAVSMKAFSSASPVSFPKASLAAFSPRMSRLATKALRGMASQPAFDSTSGTAPSW